MAERKCECKIVITTPTEIIHEGRLVANQQYMKIEKCALCREREEVGREGVPLFQDCLIFISEYDAGNLPDRILVWIKKAHELGMEVGPLEKKRSWSYDHV